LSKQGDIDNWIYSEFRSGSLRNRALGLFLVQIASGETHQLIESLVQLPFKEMEEIMTDITGCMQLRFGSVTPADFIPGYLPWLILLQSTEHRIPDACRGNVIGFLFLGADGEQPLQHGTFSGFHSPAHHTRLLQYSLVCS
jgi:hypothetical protein